MKLAKIELASVVNVIVVQDAGFAASLPGQWVECDDSVGIGFGYVGGVFTAPPAPEQPPAPPDPCEWLMDLGPFADRLGAKAFEVDTSTVPGVIAVAKDLARRKWVDLKDPRVAASLYYLAGHTVPVLGTLAVPILTDAEVLVILTTPVPMEANRALRKLYF